MPDRLQDEGSSHVRKRIPNACQRCRQQKIRCSGKLPCQQCSRRSAHCAFDDKQPKVFVSQSYLQRLEHQAARTTNQDETHVDASSAPEESVDAPRKRMRASTGPAVLSQVASTPPNNVFQDFPPAVEGTTPGRMEPEDEEASDSDASHEQDAGRITPDSLDNPLHPSNSDSFLVNNGSKRFFLGVTSNWAFGRRVLRMVHDRVDDRPLDDAALLFEGSAYDLGWDGQRVTSEPDTTCLPTADFALFLINGVKFRCGQLYHIFDEVSFMAQFARFYDNPTKQKDCPRLWYVHFLLVLAFGKAFMVPSSKDQRPAGADLFVQAMQLMPDITFLCSDPLQAIEVFCCAALFLQCLDMRSAAFNVIGQAQRMAVEQGMHTDMRSRHLSETVLERCREIWWTVYILDRQMTSLMGAPVGLSDDDISQCLPSFSGSPRKSLALNLHAKLAKSTAVILQTVYRKQQGKSSQFIASMKAALETIAKANDVRNESFPLDLKGSSSRGICRLSAYLHIFHHQSLILATRPLLYSFLQKRLQSPTPLRISSSRGTRSLVRVCIGSAQQSIGILEVLHMQGLLESFIPFDREAAFASAVVLAIADMVDPSLVRDCDSRLRAVQSIFDEMSSRGNRIARMQKQELEHLRSSMEAFKIICERNAAGQQTTPNSVGMPTMPIPDDQTLHSEQLQPGIDSMDTLLSEWNSEDGLDGQALLAIANSLDFEQLNWLATNDLEQTFGMSI